MQQLIERRSMAIKAAHTDVSKACCYQQVKTIHRLLLNLADDLGDVSIVKGADPYFAEASDLVSGTLEPQLQAMRNKLASFLDGAK